MPQLDGDPGKGALRQKLSKRSMSQDSQLGMNYNQVMHAKIFDFTMAMEVSFFCLWEWQPTIGRKVGILRKILSQI